MQGQQHMMQQRMDMMQGMMGQRMEHMMQRGTTVPPAAPPEKPNAEDHAAHH
jgi:hypothetical protein